jgi:hypothetical protein
LFNCSTTFDAINADCWFNSADGRRKHLQKNIATGVIMRTWSRDGKKNIQHLCFCYKHEKKIILRHWRNEMLKKRAMHWNERTCHGMWHWILKPPSLFHLFPQHSYTTTATATALSCNVFKHLSSCVDLITVMVRFEVDMANTLDRKVDKIQVFHHHVVH